ncbi:hypothetical protein BBP00_00005243 [Phytophthora kernoviae]|uniref:Elicitin-like protein n=1 Tax=Phytophthora kernoviae TaxID=325452 RepID=A0A3F2RQX3_9STRA|nr:hypothetical protein BBP00_00005243 [Phytophthora kernoviae]
MIKITPNYIALFVMGLVMLQTCTVDAANCTTDELTTAKSVYSDLTSALSDAVDQLPDCTGDDEIDYKTGLEAIITYCSGVTEELNQSASASASGSTGTDSSGTAESGAIGARGAMTTAVLLTQTSVAIYFFAGLL